MKNLIVILVILAVLALAVWYVIRSGKKGNKCIGCPDGCQCSGNCPGCKHK